MSKRIDFDYVEGPDPIVQLPEDKWREIISDILAAHQEYCISRDNCDCVARAKEIEKQVDYWLEG